MFVGKKHDNSANQLRIVQEEEGSCKLLIESFLGGTEANHVKLVSFFLWTETLNRYLQNTKQQRLAIKSDIT